MRRVTVFSCCALLLNGLIGEDAKATPDGRAGAKATMNSPAIQTVALAAPQATMIWVVVSSRPTLEQAGAVAQSFAATLGPALITQSRNGSFAIVTGTLFKDKAKPNLNTLKELRLVPRDAFLSNGEGFGSIVSHSYSAGTSTDLMTQTSLISSVRRLQIALTRLKLYSGLTDGLIGPGTVKAFTAYLAAFGPPPGDFLDEYALNIIEQIAQDGFRSMAERQTAQGMGFDDGETYAQAVKGGFTSQQVMFQAKQRGFQTNQDFEAASRSGFETAEEFEKGRAGGFLTADEYRAASRFRFGTRTDYVAFRSSGFADKDSFTTAQERGFSDKASYERAVAVDLKAARVKAEILLEDAQVFIRLNPQIPNLIAVADKAAILGVTLPTGTASNLEQASSQLQALLTPLSGYSDFVVARDKERTDDRRKQVLAYQQELETARVALTNWVAANISSSKLPQVVQELKSLADAAVSDDLDDLQGARQSLGILIAKNGLAGELAGLQAAGADNAYTNPGEGNAPFAVTPANAVLLSGAGGDVVSLFNASAEAPSLVRTLNGGLSFSNDIATVCLFGINETPSIRRGLRATLSPMGATVVKTSSCTSSSPKHADLIIMRRKAFLEAPPSFAVAFIDALEAKRLRRFDAIDYAKLADNEQKEIALVAAITTGVETGSRTGFGAFEVAIEKGGLCVVVTEDTDVHGDMLAAVKEMVEASTPMTVVSDRTLEQLYPMILRDECRVVYGSAGTLQQLIQALKRDEKPIAFLPIWIETDEVLSSAAKLAAVKLERTKQQEAQRLAAQESERLAAIRRQDEQSRLVVVEAELRKVNGPDANARLTKFTDFLKASTLVADGRTSGAKTMAPVYRDFIDWLEAQKTEGWELGNVDTAISDFGAVNWKDRKLDALVTRVELKFKSRERGEYRTECILFGVVLDDEFEMERDPLQTLCADEVVKLDPWKSGHGFESRWRAVSSGIATP
ncbi:hypothetical protein IFT66_00035 [Rhizobium sp. CFBP 13726]|uniref:hypothetical protein n=1 Tax=Rhizobium sp. CFBP 13726 TaxID=2775296 RepID=UPI0017859CA7|nr:hypothetical protein [Rhizobium sp. CFBP 13726]MBD8649461.1 hypothetical protein [Rhizobium sp. CFBP 13726]